MNNTVWLNTSIYCSHKNLPVITKHCISIYIKKLKKDFFYFHLNDDEECHIRFSVPVNENNFEKEYLRLKKYFSDFMVSNKLFSSKVIDTDRLFMPFHENTIRYNSFLILPVSPDAKEELEIVSIRKDLSIIVFSFLENSKRITCRKILEVMQLMILIFLIHLENHSEGLYKTYSKKLIQSSDSLNGAQVQRLLSTLSKISPRHFLCSWEENCRKYFLELNKGLRSIRSLLFIPFLIKTHIKTMDNHSNWVRNHNSQTSPKIVNSR